MRNMRLRALHARVNPAVKLPTAMHGEWGTHMAERSGIHRLLGRLKRQPQHPFPARGVRLEAPNSHGVYVIRDAAGRVVHVGRTMRGQNGLRQRLGNHLQAQSSFVISYLKGRGKRLRNGYTYQYLEVAESRNRVLLEYAATVWYCPIHLGDGSARTRQRPV